jgi:hypothetical protein
MQADFSSEKPNGDQRAAARFDTVLPVSVEGAEAWTRNISSTGIYFETDVAPEVGSLVNFTVEFTLQGKRNRLLCEGKVVRVDHGDERIGVAARLLTPFFAPAEELQGTRALQSA